MVGSSSIQNKPGVEWSIPPPPCRVCVCAYECGRGNAVTREQRRTGEPTVDRASGGLRSLDWSSSSSSFGRATTTSRPTSRDTAMKTLEGRCSDTAETYIHAYTQKHKMLPPPLQKLICARVRWEGGVHRRPPRNKHPQPSAGNNPPLFTRDLFFLRA